MNKQLFLVIVLFLIVNTSVNADAVLVSTQWGVTQQSKTQQIEATLQCEVAPSVGVFQKCSLNVFNKLSGKPETVLKNAKIGITGGMPAHHHGLPTAPVVAWSESENAYLIKGLKFSMPGEWELHFHIEGSFEESEKVIKDKVSFSFSL